MSDRQYSEELFYVAPAEPPPSRRPPALTTGTIGWLRKNLFNGWLNSIMSIITSILLVMLVYEVLRWTITEAQWNAITGNMGLIAVYQYPSDEVWRIELVALFLVFLSGLSVSIWGAVTRPLFLTIIIVTLVLVTIPAIASRIPQSSIRFIVSSPGQYGLIPGLNQPEMSFRENPVGPMMFVGDEGDEVEVHVEPINRDEYATDGEVRYRGYIEDTQTLSGIYRSRTVWTNLKTAVDFNRNPLELEFYNIVMRVQLLDSEGNLIEEILSTPENPGVGFTAELPRDDWYIINVVRYEEGEINYQSQALDGFELKLPYRYGTFYPLGAVDGVLLPREESGPYGFAWIRLNGVRLLSNKTAAVEQRIAEYGEQPDWECPSAVSECVRVPTDRNLRFEGNRDFAEYFKYHLSEFVSRSLTSVLGAVFALVFGLWMGFYASRSEPNLLKRTSRFVLMGWILSVPFSWIMISGFENPDAIHPSLDLPSVTPELWGGLALTLLLTVIPIAASFPIGILLALGRQSDLPVISMICTLFIEVVRGVPLITILFLGALLVPYFDPSLRDVNDVIRMIVGLTLFTAAYLAEVVRGGLQIIPKGQFEAARALGLNGVYTTLFIVLPQALRAVIPAIMGEFVSLFKDTSLVALVGMFELLGVMRSSIANGQQTIYGPVQREVYIFALVVYFVISFVMSIISRRLEETGSGAVRLN